jgi:hypothetical protein
MRVAIAVAKFLHSLDLVDLHLTDAGGDAFIGHMPDAPAVAVMVTSTGGVEQASRLPYDEQTIQIIVRGDVRDPLGGYDLARRIFDALQCLDLVTLDDGGEHETFVMSTTAMQSDPVPMGRDGNDRSEWSLNFRMSVAAPTAHRS